MSFPQYQPEDHYCGVCRYALDRERWDDQPDRFTHPPAVAEIITPHEPVPVPVSELVGVNMVCDFCKAPDPQWLLRFRQNVSMETHLPGVKRTDHLGEWWAVCDGCRPIVVRGQIEAVLDRVARSYPLASRKMRTAIRGQLRPVYKLLLSDGISQTILRDPERTP